MTMTIQHVRQQRILLSFLACVVALSSPVVHAATRIEIGVGADAPKLERTAADELAAQFTQLFADVDVQVKSGELANDGQTQRVLIGSPATNPSIKNLLRDSWPKISDQG